MPSGVKAALLELHDPKKAAFFPKFFKAGKGEYAEGDRFLGLSVPQMRAIAKQHVGLSFLHIEPLLADAYHEVRLVALFILTMQYEQADERQRKAIVEFYLSHLEGVNNWDLVDCSAYKILGDWLLTHDRKILVRFAKSGELWKQRIAIVSTYALIRAGDYADTLAIATLLLGHDHDLIHKAVGWMLREVGKRDKKTLLGFLEMHVRQMPRTALRYAIERFPEAERRRWLAR